MGWTPASQKHLSFGQNQKGYDQFGVNQNKGLLDQMEISFNMNNKCLDSQLMRQRKSRRLYDLDSQNSKANKMSCVEIPHQEDPTHLRKDKAWFY